MENRKTENRDGRDSKENVPIWQMKSAHGTFKREESSDFMQTKAEAYEEKTNQRYRAEVFLSDMGYKYEVYESWYEILKLSPENRSPLLKCIIRNKMMPDITVKVGNTLFYAHLMALQNYTSYFDDCEFKAQVILDENKVTPQAFTIILDWILAKQPILRLNTATAVVDAAKHLMIADLASQCWCCMDWQRRRRRDLQSRKRTIPIPSGSKYM